MFCLKIENKALKVGLSDKSFFSSRLNSLERINNIKQKVLCIIREYSYV
ncbi:hypothetical protein Pvag_0986 [Pantoea vagans C9-1]|nr:hypothetical protein Pvag_0986 [Pantoea vagans C9-1]